MSAFTMKRVLTFACLAGLSFGLSGCFLGYDSRWGASKRAQQHNAAAAAPAALESTPPPDAADTSGDAGPPGAFRAYHVRVYATPAYEALTLDWHKTVTGVIDDANRVLAPSVGVRL